MEFDEVFRDLNRAVVQRQEVKIVKQKIGSEIRWIILIRDPEKSKEFESRLFGFLQKLKRNFRGRE